jgi:hypothetical protein
MAAILLGMTGLDAFDTDAHSVCWRMPLSGDRSRSEMHSVAHGGASKCTGGGYSHLGFRPKMISRCTIGALSVANRLFWVRLSAANSNKIRKSQ